MRAPSTGTKPFFTKPASCPYYAIACSLDPATHAPYDECCVSRNGLAVLAQNYTFGLSYADPGGWTAPAVVADIGPRFTLHGLWPNGCDGAFNASDAGCDAARSCADIAALLRNTTGRFGYLQALLAREWRAGDGDNNWLWTHEWTKHGTCAESFQPRCLESPAEPRADLLGFLAAAVALFIRLDVMKAFRAAGVAPSDAVGYNRTRLNDAHAAAFGFPGGMQCVERKGRQYLSEVWTYLLEKPNHAYVVSSPSLVTFNGGAYQSCKLDKLVFIPLTPFVPSTNKLVMEE